MRVAAIVIGVIGFIGVSAAIAIVIAWGGRRFDDEPPATAADVPIGEHVVWWLRLLAVHLLAGLASGLLVAGMGGRLAMRVIAATAGRAAQGRVTEADEIVGFITLDGTIAFLLFVGLGAGVVAGLVYTVLRPVLPSGRLGGVILGGLFLVVAATRLDPLRADNPDFDVVGPDLLSIAIFGALPLLLGMTVAALSARVSTAVAPLSRDPRSWPAHLALVPPMLIAPIGAAMLLAGAIAIAVRRALASRPVVSPSRALLVSRAAVAAVALVSLPGFVVAVADIAGG